jgi:predicted HTH domain antitoxin
MGVTITTRVPEEIEEKIARIAREEKLDKSTVIRRLLSDALRQRQIERALKEYREGKITLARAARMADVSLRKMMQLAAEAGVPFQYSIEDLRKDFKAALE